MRAPPQDAKGRVRPHDHEQIQDEDIMLRGIPEQQIVPTPDGGRRISTGAFSRSSDTYGGLSLGVKKVLECLEKTTDEWAAGRFSAVVCFPAKMLREAGVQIGWDPLDDDPAHCNAWEKSGKTLPAQEIAWERPRHKDQTAISRRVEPLALLRRGAPTHRPAAPDPGRSSRLKGDELLIPQPLADNAPHQRGHLVDGVGVAVVVAAGAPLTAAGLRRFRLRPRRARRRGERRGRGW